MGRTPQYNEETKIVSIRVAYSKYEEIKAKLIEYSKKLHKQRKNK